MATHKQVWLGLGHEAGWSSALSGLSGASPVTSSPTLGVNVETFNFVRNGVVTTATGWVVDCAHFGTLRGLYVGLLKACEPQSVVVVLDHSADLEDIRRCLELLCALHTPRPILLLCRTATGYADEGYCKLQPLSPSSIAASLCLGCLELPWLVYACDRLVDTTDDRWAADHHPIGDASSALLAALSAFDAISLSDDGETSGAAIGLLSQDVPTATGPDARLHLNAVHAVVEEMGRCDSVSSAEVRMVERRLLLILREAGEHTTAGEVTALALKCGLWGVVEAAGRQISSAADEGAIREHIDVVAAAAALESGLRLRALGGKVPLVDRYRRCLLSAAGWLLSIDGSVIVTTSRSIVTSMLTMSLTEFAGAEGETTSAAALLRACLTALSPLPANEFVQSFRYLQALPPPVIAQLLGAAPPDPLLALFDEGDVGACARHARSLLDSGAAPTAALYPHVFSAAAAVFRSRAHGDVTEVLCALLEHGASIAPEDEVEAEVGRLIELSREGCLAKFHRRPDPIQIADLLQRRPMVLTKCPTCEGWFSDITTHLQECALCASAEEVDRAVAHLHAEQLEKLLAVVQTAKRATAAQMWQGERMLTLLQARTVEARAAVPCAPLAPQKPCAVS